MTKVGGMAAMAVTVAMDMMMMVREIVVAATMGGAVLVVGTMPMAKRMAVAETAMGVRRGVTARGAIM